MVHTHCEEFGSRCTGTGESSFVPVQIQPDFLLSHLLEEISTYFLKFRDASEKRKECIPTKQPKHLIFTSHQCNKDGLYHRTVK